MTVVVLKDFGDNHYFSPSPFPSLPLHPSPPFTFPPYPSPPCRARGNQIVEHNSDNETVLGGSRKLEGAAKHLIDGSDKRICRLSFEF